VATKAERFRYWAERAGPKKQKSPPRPKRDFPVDTAKAGTSASDRRAGFPRKESAGKRAIYAFEVTGGKPTRKSTRKSGNRQRTDAQMRMKRRTAEVRPAERPTRRPR
jgi:hypothetical protein